MRFFALATLAYVSVTDALRLNKAPVVHPFHTAYVSTRMGLKQKAEAKCESHEKDFAHGIWHMVNTNGDGHVSKKELTDALDYVEEHHEEIFAEMEAGFKAADADSNGHLTVSEMEKAISGWPEEHKKFARAMFKMFDHNGDDQVSWEAEVLATVHWLAENWEHVRPHIEAEFDKAAGDDANLTLAELDAAMGC